jgi:cytosine/adenosine deaminase-related metal-dependent hydrolase
MKQTNTTFTFKPLILEEIRKNGGWVNAHAHVDRAFTINPDSLEMYTNHTLEEKWDLVDAVKKDASEDEYYDRFCRAFEVMIANGVTVIGSFVDIDPVCKDRAIKGGLRAREQYKDRLIIKFATQTLKGVIAKEPHYWFDLGSELVDIIGGLPKRDERDFGTGFGAKHIDILLEAGKRLDKLVHVHVDQFNTPTDVEMELLCDLTIKHGMVGRVTAIHGISLGAHEKAYRQKVYKKMKKAGVSIITCPMAWIDHPRRDEHLPSHNSLTPVDELVPAGITVAIGTDNICDFMVPFCDGDMWQELSVLAAGTRFTNIPELVKIATTNGRKILGIT